MKNILRSLNYHHLLYFRTVVKEGGIQKAARALGLSHPTVSGQLRLLEDQLERPLFDRSGRRLELTDTGAMVFRYADEIFDLGEEMMKTLEGHAVERPPPLVVGVDDGMPKALVRLLLEPALALPVRLVCEQDRHDRLLAELAVHRLDVVLTDAPLPPASGVKAFNHFLGEASATFLAAPAIATRLRPGFPQSLEGAPFLAPAEGTSVRRSLARFFRELEVEPLIVAELGDSALMKTFAQGGHGCFCIPTPLAESVRRTYRVGFVGHTDAIRWRFYAVSPERRVTNPAVAAVCEHGARILGGAAE